ncbi:hypothetical protein V8D89_004091 [Ganoderma adspersum]
MAALSGCSFSGDLSLPPGILLMHAGERKPCLASQPEPASLTGCALFGLIRALMLVFSLGGVFAGADRE